MDTRIVAALDALAALYRYPREDLPELMSRALEAVAPFGTQPALDLAPLVTFIRDNTLWEWEELHVRTFDLNPVCALEVGYQVYGERYARGTFLVRMGELARETEVDCGQELADHLTTVLSVAARVDPARGVKMAESFALPALAQMRKAFEGGENPYSGLVDATTSTLCAAFNVDPDAIVEVTPEPESAYSGGME